MSKDIQKEEEKLLRQQYSTSFEHLWKSIKDMPLEPMMVAQFYMGNSDFLEKPDLDLLKNNFYKFSRNFLFASAVGCHI